MLKAVTGPNGISRGVTTQNEGLACISKPTKEGESLPGMAKLPVVDFCPLKGAWTQKTRPTLAICVARPWFSA